MFEKITSSCKLILCCKNFTLKPKEKNQIKNLKCINNNKKHFYFCIINYYFFVILITNVLITKFLFSFFV